MLPRKVARSSTLRLALVYVGLFSAAIFGLLAYVYWSTASDLDQDAERLLNAERRVLAQTYDQGGRRGLVSLISRRVGDERLSGWYYEIFDAAFMPLAGNAPEWPRGASPGGGAMDWSASTTLFLSLPSEKPAALRATYRTLPNGDHLLLAHEVDALDGLGTRSATSLSIAAALFLLLAAAAGISTTRRSISRIETINATSREIMRSGLGRRIPLRGTGDEWDDLAANLNSMLNRIEQLVETNRQVFDNIAHDLRTPLTRMRARLERAAMRSMDTRGYHQLVQDAISELDAVLRTFSSLLRISRIEASERDAGFRRLDLAELVGEVLELFDAAAEEHAVRIVLSAARPAPISSDRDLLFDAISNLVDNAIKHGGGEVRVTVRGGAEGACVAIGDRGPGIPAGERERVFDRFYRLEHSRKSPGNGLGLSLVAAVANLHGARIEMADNAPGLRIALHFPPARGEAATVDGIANPNFAVASG